MRRASCRRSAAGIRRVARRRRVGRPLVEFEYQRGGTLAYLAAWDVHHANLFDRVEPKTGIEPFGRLVEQVMTTEPYASARTVFWIVDNGSSPRRQDLDQADAGALAERSADPPPGPRLLAEPDRALLLDRATQSADPERLRHTSTRSPTGCSAFGEHYRQIARPFEWTFTRQDLDQLLARIDRHEPHSRSPPNDQNLRTRLLVLAAGGHDPAGPHH